MKTGRFYVKAGAIAAVALAIVGYSAFELRAVAEGPQLIIDSPTDGQSFTDPLISVSGSASHISFLYLNGRQIYTDETGHFSEKMALAKGYNVLTVEATGRFNKTTAKNLTVVAQ